MNPETTDRDVSALDENMSFSGPVVDIAQFGAKGDGVTDDTAAIQSALDHLAQQGGTLNLAPDQTYVITGGLLLQDAENFKIDGNGATIEVAGDAALEDGESALRIEGADHFALADLSVDDGREAGPSADASSAEASSASGIEIAGGEDFYLSQVSSINFENIGGPAVNLSVLGAAGADDIAESGTGGQAETETAADTGSDDVTRSGETSIGTTESGTLDGDSGTTPESEDDTLLQSVNGLSNDVAGSDTLDFSSVSGETTAGSFDVVEDQRLHESLNDTGSTNADMTAAQGAGESGQDDVTLLGVQPQTTFDVGDFATS